MQTYQVALTRVSRNAKVGPIPVSTTEATTCPPACGLSKAGCYADGGPLAIFWRKVNERKAGMAWDNFLQEVKALPKLQLWRHNQAGDLPGIGNAIDTQALAQLVKAQKGKRGWTYTHKPATPENIEAIREANAGGFTINLSANTLAQADTLAATQSGPVVVILPADAKRAVKTPAGRHVAICPATLSEKVTCANCGLCQLTGRKSIIGFPAHGIRKRAASELSQAA